VPNGNDGPVVLDMATSVAPEGRVRALLAAGRSLPEGCVIDHRGEPTTNPADLYGPPRGALLPFGGHKGFGLALLVDALAGGLSGAGCCQPDSEKRAATDGVFLVAINIATFRPLADFADEIRGLCAHVRTAPVAPGVTEVMVPGQAEANTRRQRLRDGIPVDESTWSLLKG
jgi:uncharacterized oxidoreductase